MSRRLKEYAFYASVLALVLISALSLTEPQALSQVPVLQSIWNVAFLTQQNVSTFTSPIVSASSASISVNFTPPATARNATAYFYLSGTVSGSGGVAITPQIWYYEPQSGLPFQMLSATALTSAGGEEVLTWGANAPTTANISQQTVIPPLMKVVYVISGSGGISFPVNFTIIWQN